MTTIHTLTTDQFVVLGYGSVAILTDARGTALRCGTLSILRTGNFTAAT